MCGIVFADLQIFLTHTVVCFGSLLDGRALHLVPLVCRAQLNDRRENLRNGQAYVAVLDVLDDRFDFLANFGLQKDHIISDLVLDVCTIIHDEAAAAVQNFDVRKVECDAAEARVPLLPLRKKAAGDLFLQGCCAWMQQYALVLYTCFL